MANERVVSQEPVAASVYEIPNFWTINGMVVGINVVLGAGMEILSWYRGFPLWIPVIIYGLLFVYGLGRLRHAPQRVEVSAQHLRFVLPYTRALDMPWYRVRSILLVRPRYTHGKIEHARIALEGAPTMILTPRIRRFDALIDQLRALHPELIRE